MVYTRWEDRLPAPHAALAAGRPLLAERIPMHGGSGHRLVPFTANRRMVAASSSVGRESNTIHCLTEVDVDQPRRLLREHEARTGEKLSLTAYVVTGLARALVEHPGLNAFRKGRSLVVLEDVTLSVLVERDLAGEKVPEPCAIRAAQTKSFREIHEEIRAAQRHTSDRLGSLSGMTWVVRLIPGFLLRWFMRLASGTISMRKRYGAVGVTAVGMFTEGAAWFVPLTSATVTITVGSIVERPVLRDGRLENREHLCLTASFDHDVVDGAPAARFMSTFAEILGSGELVRDALGQEVASPGSAAR